MEQTKEYPRFYWNWVDSVVEELLYDEYNLLTKKELKAIMDCAQNKTPINLYHSEGMAFDIETTIGIISIAFTAIDILWSIYVFNKQNKQLLTSKDEVIKYIDSHPFQMSDELKMFINNRFDELEHKVLAYIDKNNNENPE